MARATTLSVVIPAYNEARRLPATLQKVLKYLEGSSFSRYEVIVVDDGSSDRTSKIAEQFSLGQAHVRVLNGQPNHGKGWVTRRGVLAATGEYILCTDADLSTPIKELDTLFARMASEGADVAIGSRKAPGSIVEQPFHRRVLSSASNGVIRLVLGLPYGDTQCGFKLYRREAARALFKQLSLPRFGFDFEILNRAHKLKLQVVEVGVRWTHSPFTTVRMRDVFQSFVDVFRVRFGIYGRSGISPQLLRFMAVGVVNTTIDVGIYFLLTRETGAFAGQLVAAKVLSFLVASMCSLLLNRSWTFKIQTRLSWAEAARFYASASFALVVNVSVLYVLTHFFGVYDLIALVFATGASFLANYTLARGWVFRARSQLVRVYQ